MEKRNIVRDQGVKVAKESIFWKTNIGNLQKDIQDFQAIKHLAMLDKIIQDF